RGADSILSETAQRCAHPPVNGSVKRSDRVRTMGIKGVGEGNPERLRFDSLQWLSRASNVLDPASWSPQDCSHPQHSHYGARLLPKGSAETQARLLARKPSLRKGRSG